MRYVSVLAVWHVLLTLVLKVTQSYSLLLQSFFVVRYKKLQIDIVTYAIIWISHF